MTETHKSLINFCVKDSKNHVSLMVTSAAECLYVTYGNSGQLAHAES